MFYSNKPLHLSIGTKNWHNFVNRFFLNNNLIKAKVDNKRKSLKDLFYGLLIFSFT